MLSKSNDTTIHVKNIQTLMIEFDTYLYRLLDPIMKEFLTKRILKCNLRSCRVTLLPNPKAKACGTNAVAYKAAQCYSMLQANYKNLPLLDLFKYETRNWHCSGCPCNIC